LEKLLVIGDVTMATVLGGQRFEDAPELLRDDEESTWKLH